MNATRDSSTSIAPKHLAGIDSLRGIAAIGVLVFHYPQFYMAQAGAPIMRPAGEMLPFEWLLWPLYQYGNIAVQMFWIISGFIFCHVYGRRFDTTLKSFSVNRIARLYPLHFVTLLIVAAIQTANVYWFGVPQVYGNNDAYHFVLQLFMASNWGLQQGDSFNGPIWSVSVEIIAYAVFFALLLLRSFRPVGAVAAFIAAVALFALTKSLAAACVMYFFGGVILYFVCNFVAERSKVLNLTLAALCVMASLGVFFTVMQTPAFSEYALDFLRFFVFMGVVWVVAAAEYFWRLDVVPGARWLADISYSTYLTHIPITLIFMLLMDGVLKSRSIVSAPLFFLVYFAVVMIVATLVYRYFERPAQRYVRSVLNRPTLQAA